jgi:hypothetical protein
MFGIVLALSIILVCGILIYILESQPEEPSVGRQNVELVKEFYRLKKKHNG